MARLDIQRVVFLVFVAFAVSVASSGEASWGYEPDNGPSTWPVTFPEYCAGQKQSPIDILHSDAVPKALGEFTFTGFETPPAGAAMTLLNSGHNAQVNLQGDYTISGADLPGTFNVAQFHFHWGNESSVGSEHQIDSTQYAVEMHVVSYDSKYPDFATAVDNVDGVAVIGTLIEVGAANNGAYDTLINALSNVIYKDDTYSFPSPFSILPMLPSELDEYYRYRASLTTPLCQETVIWSVMKNRVQLSEQQIDKFRDLMFNAEGEDADPMVNNFRPPQPLYGRKVDINDMSIGDAASARPLWALIAISFVFALLRI